MLVLAYYSWKDPIFQSAVLPYFIEDRREKDTLVLVTFESKAHQLSSEELLHNEALCLENNIVWKRLKWRSGHLKLLKKAFDFIESLLYIGYWAKHYNIKTIYSEGFPGAILGHLLSRILRLKHAIHTFEPHADYMLESGIWQKSSWEYYLNKWFEYRVALSATYILTATNAYINLWSAVTTTTKYMRVPSCVDTKLLAFSQQNRTLKRKALGYSSADKVFVYLGKKDGMYWSEHQLSIFFREVSLTIPTAKLLIISLDTFPVLTLQAKVSHVSCKQEEVASLLSACDVAICGIVPIPSRQYSSPIKNGEYWGNGLNVIIPKGISDDYLVAEEQGLGLVFDMGNETMTALAKRIESNNWLFNRNSKAVAFVRDDRGITKYKKLYGELFNFS